MAKNSVAGKLTSLDDLFTTQAERDEAKREAVRDIPLSEIHDFPNHPFKVRDDEAMMELADSIRQHGVLVPALVRPKADGGYEMVAGHRRKHASELANCETLSCIVRELSDDEATIIMVDSNLQRETVLPSEKAFAYKMKLEAMKRQGQRTDLTSSPVATKLDTATVLGRQSGEKLNLCLCSVCADNFRNTGAFTLRRTGVEQAGCVYCGRRLGVDYEVIQNKQGRGGRADV